MSPIQGYVGVMANDPEPRRNAWQPAEMGIGEEQLYEQWDGGRPPPFVGTNRRPCGSERAWLGARIGRELRLAYDWFTGVALCCGVPPLPLIIGGAPGAPGPLIAMSAIPPLGGYVWPSPVPGPPPGSLIWPTVPLASGDDLLVRDVIASGLQVYQIDDRSAGGYVIGSTTHSPSSGTLLAGGLLGAGDSGLVIGPVAAGADLVWARAGIPSSGLSWAGVPLEGGGMVWPATGLLGGSLIVVRLGIGGFGPKLTWALQQLISTDGISWGGRVTPPSANGIVWESHDSVTSGTMSFGSGSVGSGSVELSGLGVSGGIIAVGGRLASGGLGMGGVSVGGGILLSGSTATGRIELLGSVPAPVPIPASPATVTAPGVYSWIIPPGVTVIQCEATGGGAGGQTGNPLSPSGNGAGGGGLYAITLAVPVSPGSIVTVVVGAGGLPGPGNANLASAAGGDSWVSTTGVGPLTTAEGVLAGGAPDPYTGSAGATIYLGDARSDGGNGGDPGPVSVTGGGGGGSGGAGGAGSNGGAGTGLAGGAGGAGQGAGGNGGGLLGTGANGIAPGGGGGGGSYNAAIGQGGGSGADGQVVITY